MSPLPFAPALHPQVRAFTLGSETTAFLGVLGPTVLFGRPFARLVPRLDGTRTVESLAAELADDFGSAAVLLALHQLYEEDLLVESAAGAVAPPLASDFVTNLECQGLQDSSRPGLQLLICSDELASAVAAQAAQARGEWLLVTLGASYAAIGPCFAPGRAPCLTCFTARRRELRSFDAYVLTHGRECTPPRSAALPAAVVAHATQRLRAALRDGLARPDEVWTLDLIDGSWSSHRVLPHQTCPHCTPAMTPALLAAAPTLDPALHVDGYTGIVSRIGEYNDPAPGMVCAFAEHLFPPDVGRADALERCFRRRSSGKGPDASAARTSALMEALERYSGAARGNEPVVHATQADLGPDALPPDLCMGFSARQYQERDRTNPGALVQAWVPSPWDPHQPIDWVTAWSLTAQRQRFIPASFCFYGFPDASGATCAVTDSNGCAAGVSVEDAVVRGILELVERDAVGLWWYSRALRPPAALEGGRAADIAAVTAAYADAGRELSFLDLTTEFGIPAAAALSWQRGTGDCITIGFGAAFDPHEALQRAVTEMNQFLPEALECGPGRVLGANSLRDAYLHSCATAPRLPASAWPATPGDQIARWAALASSQGLDVVVVNQTRPDVRVPVVKVIIPGLCHFWPRFRPARLYQAPLALGWTRQALEEASLNPARILL